MNQFEQPSSVNFTSNTTFFSKKKKILKNLLAEDLKMLEKKTSFAMDTIHFKSSQSETFFYLVVNHLKEDICLYQNEFLLSREKAYCQLLLDKLNPHRVC